ncbi:MAG TPA: hypothetical protein VIH67_06095 [Candidatus Acidoferrum sp.]
MSKPRIDETHAAVGLMLLQVLALATMSPVWAQERPRKSNYPQQSEALMQPDTRKVFDSAPFSRDKAVPYWTNGYLVSRVSETVGPGTFNVTLYDRTGNKAGQAAIWFEGSARVIVKSASVTTDGRIIASGEADKPDGTRARFIAATDSSGNVTDVIQTREFSPANTCAAPDGTVWSFGTLQWDAAKGVPLQGDTLRQFDTRKGQLAGYVPRSIFPNDLLFEALAFIRCSGDGVVVYSPLAGVYIEMQRGVDAPVIYQAPMPVDTRLTGFAVLGAGKIYGLLRSEGSADTSIRGLYSLLLDDNNKTGSWQPVQGTVGTRRQPGTVIQLYGTDGGSLVFSRAEDPLGESALHWAKPY